MSLIFSAVSTAEKSSVSSSSSSDDDATEESTDASGQLKGRTLFSPRHRSEEEEDESYVSGGNSNIDFEGSKCSVDATCNEVVQ